MKLTMKISVIVMTVITLVMAVLGSRQVFAHAEGDFKTTWILWGVMILLGVFVAVQAV